VKQKAVRRRAGPRGSGRGTTEKESWDTLGVGSLRWGRGEETACHRRPFRPVENPRRSFCVRRPSLREGLKNREASAKEAASSSRKSGKRKKGMNPRKGGKGGRERYNSQRCKETERLFESYGLQEDLNRYREGDGGTTNHPKEKKRIYSVTLKH